MNKEMSKGQVRELFEIDARIGIYVQVQRLIRELTRKPENKSAPRVFNKEGFEITRLNYAPDLATIKAESGIMWEDYVSDANFPRRSFEQGVGEVQTKLHTFGRLIWSVEAILELEDMSTTGATVREGVEWALTHNVDDYPKNVVIGLLGSARRGSDRRLGVPVLSRCQGQWYLNSLCHYEDLDQWNASTQFLAVRRKFQH